MGKGRGRQDPFGTYQEWANHRYDPGHYLGGTIEPHLRTSELGRRARRMSGGMLLLAGASGLLWLLPSLQTTADVPRGLQYLEVLSICAISALVIAAGVIMYRSGGKRLAERARNNPSPMRPE